MLRPSCLILMAAIAVPSASVDVHACGDKFLRVGRSVRYRQYASVHPSAILVYAPEWSRNGIAAFETMLQRAGHTAVTVTTAADLTRALAAARYDLLITRYAHAAAARQALPGGGTSPALLPVLYKPGKTEKARAESEYPFLLRAGTMTTFEALEEIDRVLDEQVKRAAASSGSR